MSDFADVERFAREHIACGGLTPSAMPRPGGGYLLTIACACGRSFDRWVSSEEARQPLPIPRHVVRAAAAPPPVPAAEPAAALARPARALPSKSKPRPSAEIESLVREALATEPPAPEAAPRGAPDGVATPPPVPTASWRPAPESAPHGPAQPDVPLPPPPLPPRRGSRGRAVWLGLFVVIGLGAAAAYLLLFAHGEPPAAPVRSSASARTTEPQRTALAGATRVLRELHTVATSTTSLSVYSAQAGAAKAEVDYFLATDAAPAHRASAREALALHRLAVAAWRARSLGPKASWETLALDPSLDLCRPLKSVFDLAIRSESPEAPPADATAQALPLLWECANERIVALEQALTAR
jgi:hypothetical protein